MLLVFAVIGGFVDYRLETYEAWHAEQTGWLELREGRINPMPSLNDLSEAKKILFQRYIGNFWGEEAYTLIAEYDRKQYEKAKQLLEETLLFETDILDQGTRAPKIEPEFIMGRFHVRLLKIGDLPYAINMPEYMCFVGISDETCEIVYICYDDVDLDSLSGSFNDDLPKMIHWSSIERLKRTPSIKVVPVL